MANLQGLLKSIQNIMCSIVKGIFGGKDKYLEAVKELETELYRVA
ncbi:MAG: hypothetical protein ACR2J3_13605 [Aridibacter sp.]